MEREHRSGGPNVQEMPESVPRLRLELKKALAERDALERRLKQVLSRQTTSVGSPPSSSPPGASQLRPGGAKISRDASASATSVRAASAGPSMPSTPQVLFGPCPLSVTCLSCELACVDPCFVSC